MGLSEIMQTQGGAQNEKREMFLRGERKIISLTGRLKLFTTSHLFQSVEFSHRNPLKLWEVFEKFQPVKALDYFISN